MLKTKKQTLISLIICFLLGFLSSCHKEPEIDRYFYSVKYSFFSALDDYYKKHKQYPESIKELSLKKPGTNEYLYPKLATVENVYKVGLTWKFDLRLSLDGFGSYHYNDPKPEDLGYGAAYGDLKTYLPTLHNEIENTNSPRLIGCDGMILYQPMGENNQDYIILICEKNGHISYLHNSEHHSKDSLISVEKKMIIYDKYFDPYDPKQADFY